MSGKIRIRMGGKIIEGGRVFRIYKTEKKKIEGKPERVIFYRPYFKDESVRTITCSIPESNLNETSIRNPVSTKELKEVLYMLAKKMRGGRPLDINRAKVELTLNDLMVTAKIVRRYWREKQKSPENFTKTKDRVLEQAMRRLCEEFAVVQKTSLVSAEKSILRVLGG